MRVGSLAFRPALVPSLLTLAVTAILLALGFWQLERARQKASIQESFIAHTALPAIPITELDLSNPASRFRQVIARGRYDPGRQILLDNQVQNGRPGFHVFTPLRVEGMAQAILVNRGWAPLAGSRRQLPDSTVTDTPVMLSGRLGQPANPGLRLAGPSAAGAPAWPRVVQYVDYAQLAAELGYPLAPAVILLDPQSENGYRREWHPPLAGFGPERHRGYAVQWFSLAATLMAIYLAVNTHRCRLE